MPKIVDHDSRREEVAQAVWQVIAKRGIGATTIREIARAARCSTGVLAHYFKDKNELLLYALRIASMRAANRMQKRMLESAGGETLRRVIYEALPIDKERRTEWQIWVSFWGEAVSNASFVKEQKRRYIEWRAFARDLLLEEQRAGRIRKDIDAKKEADSIIALVDGVGLQATIEPRRLPPKRQREIVDRYLSTLSCR
ncbi:TetR family transcriptional regulator [Candidatus Poribacteria bacterium]|nr:TetR family transcriptional regulator [Candidatus Poribacteria bacterium]